ncbi:glycoside hydrolase [Apiosordaria backusii]|uniref:alpha-1,2-Mannosidase n=1 Tax=Apiosordaria backusii TaxID=314023 RepID=A0AA40K3A1_9PEZI|nr:glycoside hydrolase [Apiosordaria backusii]
MLLDRRMRRLFLVAFAFAFFIFLLNPSARRRSFYRPISDTPSPSKGPTTSSSTTSSSPEEPPDSPPPQNHHLPPIRFHPSSFSWSTAKQHHPVPLKHKLPQKGSHSSSLPPPLQPIQFFFPPGYKPTNLTLSRCAAVKSAFLKSWSSYKHHAWLSDELSPVSGHGKTTFGGWAATLVDSLDTLWIMDLKTEFYLAAAAACKIDFAKSPDTSLNWALLEKAGELGDMLYMAFDTPNRLPPFWLDFQKAKHGGLRAGTNEPSATAASLTLEFTRLAQLTGEERYYDAVGRVVDFLEGTQGRTKLPGMWPRMVNYRDGTADADGVFSLGALADSLYEYLPKMAALLGRRRPGRLERMWKEAMGVVEGNLIFKPMLGEEDLDEMGEQWDILAAFDLFCGGMFGLGGRLFGNKEHVKIGEQLARGCAWAYGAFPTGLMPEIFDLIPCEGDWRDGPCKFDEDRWRKDGNKKLKKPFKSARDARYILRPEAIESLFVMFRITGKKELQELAWEMFQSVVKSTETELGFSAIGDVTVQGPTKKLDSMESFWLAETLKYFYLIFSPPDLISLDEFVLNTEAHPFRRDSSGFITRGFPDEPPLPKRRKKKPGVP